MNKEPIPKGTEFYKPAARHFIFRDDRSPFGPPLKNGTQRFRRRIQTACKRELFGALQADKKLFEKYTTVDISRVTCRQCAHEARRQGIYKPGELPPGPPPKPVFHDPWADDDTPIGQDR